MEFIDRRSDLYQMISDCSKDARGYRDRSDYSNHSIKELEAVLQRYSEELDERIEEDRKAELRAVAELEEAVDRIIQCGAGNRSTALRWLHQEHKARFGWEDKTSFQYDYGLPFEYSV